MHKNYLLALIGGFAFVFSGCGVRQYCRVSLPVVSKNNAHWVAKKDDVSVQLRIVGNREITTLLSGRNFAKRKKIRAFLLTVGNGLSEAIELDQELLKLPVLSVLHAYDLLAYHVNVASGMQVGLGASLGLVALFTAPVGLPLLILSFAYPPLFILSGPWVACAAGAPLLIINSNYMSTDAEQFNRELLEDLEDKMRMPMIIKPARAKTCMVCTDQLRTRFALTMRGRVSGRLIPFVVDIPADVVA